MIVVCIGCCLGDQIKKGEMGDSYSTYARQKKSIQVFGWETRRKSAASRTQAYV